ncbi:MAG TPA: adenine phosphoribosyltransferase [Gemmatimonadaceae bacterium]|nr:adenine phosphoribosyltransferase [Gemmatimonadaceae bacterium]
MSPGAAARSTLEVDVRRTLREVPDFPKPGIMFKDITPVLADAGLYARVTDAMAEPFAGAGITHVVAVESRGFLLAGPIARRLGAGLIPMRKPGKLPFDVMRQEYALEYGTDCLEMHRDALSADSRVLIVDDVLATGGTARAACLLAERHARQVVGCSFLLELADLGGRAALAGRTVSAVLTA